MHPGRSPRLALFSYEACGVHGSRYRFARVQTVARFRKRRPVFQEPAVLIFLSFEQAEQHFLDIAEPVAWRCFWSLASNDASRISMVMVGSLGLRVRERVVVSINKIPRGMGRESYASQRSEKWASAIHEMTLFPSLEFSSEECGC